MTSGCCHVLYWCHDRLDGMRVASVLFTSVKGMSLLSFALQWAHIRVISRSANQKISVGKKQWSDGGAVLGQCR